MLKANNEDKNQHLITAWSAVLCSIVFVTCFMAVCFIIVHYEQPHKSSCYVVDCQLKSKPHVCDFPMASNNSNCYGYYEFAMDLALILRRNCSHVTKGWIGNNTNSLDTDLIYRIFHNVTLITSSNRTYHSNDGIYLPEQIQVSVNNTNNFCMYQSKKKYWSYQDTGNCLNNRTVTCYHDKHHIMFKDEKPDYIAGIIVAGILLLLVTSISCYALIDVLVKSIRKRAAQRTYQYLD